MKREWFDAETDESRLFMETYAIRSFFLGGPLPWSKEGRRKAMVALVNNKPMLPIPKLKTAYEDIEPFLRFCARECYRASRKSSAPAVASKSLKPN